MKISSNYINFIIVHIQSKFKRSNVFVEGYKHEKSWAGKILKALTDPNVLSDWRL